MKISIITTCFNSAGTIRATIESILNQSGAFELEYVLTDAGSSDGTREIIGEYASRLRLIDAPGLSQAQGINLGLRQSGGDVVAFLNADDVYEPGALGKVAAAFEGSADVMWLVGQCRIIDTCGEEMTSWITSYKNLLLRCYSYPLLLCENFICQPAVFWRRQLLQTHGYLSEVERYAIDYDYWLRLGADHRPLIVSQYLAGFRRFPGTKSNSGYKQQFKEDYWAAVKYARLSGHYWTIPIKSLLTLKTLAIYPFLYGV